MILSKRNIKSYMLNGYVTPSLRLTSENLILLQDNIDIIINETDPNLVCPHIKGGSMGELNNKNYKYEN